MTTRRRAWWAAGVALAALCVIAAGCGGGSSAPAAGDGARTAGQAVTSTANGITTAFRSEPDPPQPGDNSFEVTVTQQDGAPITDATVTAAFVMPAMPAMNMPEMRSNAPLTHVSQGTYRGTGQISMAGTWNVTITVARGNEPIATQRFSVVTK